MKKLICPLLLLCLSYVSYAQNGVGIGTTTPHADALLHVNAGNSTTRGILFSGLNNNSATIPSLNAGSRMMYFPGKAVFRAGFVSGTQWNNNLAGFGSAVVGNNSTASGEASKIIGDDNEASGARAMVFGFGSRATGPGSIAIGLTSEATNEGAIAIGSYSVASDRFALAIGNGYALAPFSMAIGQNVTASALHATAMGNGTVASGVNSFALGQYSRASGINAFATGQQTRASGEYSVAMGYGTVAKGSTSTVVGAFNDTAIYNTANPLFLVGNGSPAVGSNALVVKQDGHVGIGNINPQFALDVESRMRVRSAVGNTAGVWFNNTTNTNTNGFVGMFNDNLVGLYGHNGAGWGILMNTTNGNVGLGTTTPSQKLHVVGSICYTGSSAACSDIRYKTSFMPLTDALASVMQLQPIYYHWKPEYNDKGFGTERQLGFSAQEIEQFFPEIVQTDSEGYKAVDYSRMTPVLVQAMKEQQQQLAEKDKEIQALKQRLDRLEALLLKGQ